MSYPKRSVPVSGNPMEQIFFVDIETVSNRKSFPPSQPDASDEFFRKKFEWIFKRDNKQWEDIYKENASLFAEFGRIVNVTIGKLQTVSGQQRFYVKSIFNLDEVQLLKDANEAISKATILCSHNGREFDYPFWFRRCLINNLQIPIVLNTIGKKTWDVQDGLLDTMAMWASTSWNYRVSMDHLCHLFGIESPKGEIDGSMINDLFYSIDEFIPGQSAEEILSKIGKYGSRDVIALANVYRKFKMLPPIAADQIIYVNEQKTPTEPS